MRDDYSRWIAFQTFDVLWIDGALVDESEYAIEGSKAIFFRDVFFELADNFLSLFLRKSLKIGLCDL